MAGRRLRGVSGLYALILAAGSGSRFGGGKLMTPWRGGVLLDGALTAAKAAPVEGVFVAVGADPQVAFYLTSKGVTVVEAADHARGLSASLKAGVASLPKDASGVIVFLGDMPLIPHGLAGLLAQALADGAPAAVPEYRGRTGNPAALSAVLFPAIAALDGDRGARTILEGLGAQLARVACDDPGVLADVDRPDDLPA
jgi:molybdenum cofactor cytidylyltransferase